MKAFVLICCFFLHSAPLQAQEILKGKALADKITKIKKANPTLKAIPFASGMIEWAHVTAVDPHGLKIMDSTGVRKVPFSELSHDVQKAFGYDPAAAAAFAEADKKAAAAVASELEQLNKDYSSKEKAAASRRAAIEILKKGPIRFDAEIETVIKEGILVRAYTLSADLLTGTIEADHVDEPFFLYGNWDEVDGRKLSFKVYYAGNYQYRTVLGAIKTVRAFATTPEKALDILWAKP